MQNTRRIMEHPLDHDHSHIRGNRTKLEDHLCMITLTLVLTVIITHSLIPVFPVMPSAMQEFLDYAKDF